MVLTSPDTVEGWAKAAIAVSTLLGGGYALVRRWLARRKKARERAALESKAIRYLVDSMRHILDVMTPNSDGRSTSITELSRQDVLIRGIRKQLWEQDGHQAEIGDAMSQNIEREVLRVLTRTQRIRLLKDDEPSGGDNGVR